MKASISSSRIRAIFGPCAARSSRAGFTLVEILVALLVLSSLAALFLPDLLGPRVRAKDGVAQHALRSAYSSASGTRALNDGNFVAFTPAWLASDLREGFQGSYVAYQEADQQLVPGPTANPRRIALLEASVRLFICNASQGERVFCILDEGDGSGPWFAAGPRVTALGAWSREGWKATQGESQANPDPDQDGIATQSDNCPDHANPDQADADADGMGDACEVADPDQADPDADGVASLSDNCPAHANPDQADADGDGLGDACDPTPAGEDQDADGIIDSLDNCASRANPEQEDSDTDGIGDSCDPTPYGPDQDGDGVPDDADNCSSLPNPAQADSDNDGVGNACDPTPYGPDQDGDEVPDSEDNCPAQANSDQADQDSDGRGDLCDSQEEPPVPAEDSDGDGVADRDDNCPNLVNPNQADSDNDGQGDACDPTPQGPDSDGDGVPDRSDNCRSDSNSNQLDSDGDGQGDACDPTPYGDPTGSGSVAASGGPLYPLPGIVGLDSVTLPNNSLVDSGLGSNGLISLGNNSSVGKLVLAPAAPEPSLKQNVQHQGLVRRSQEQGPFVLPLPDFGNTATVNHNSKLSASSYYNPATRSLSLPHNATLVLSSGTYNLCSISMGNQSKIQLASGAQVRIFIDSPERPLSGCMPGSGNLTAVNNAEWVNAGSAANLQLYAHGSQDGSHTVEFKNNAEFAGSIYAPRSQVVFKNNGEMRGGISAKSVEFKNNTQFRWDPDLANLRL